MRIASVMAWFVVTLISIWISLIASRECGPGPGFLGAGVAIAVGSLAFALWACARRNAFISITMAFVAEAFVYAMLVRLCSSRWAESAGGVMQWLRRM